jgi:DNA invertase Pin-like site-specific DNA recombinase/DNA-binding Lrp family transcriptional regulator
MHSEQDVASLPSRPRAAQYIRMSTDRQVYSTEGQAAAIAVYAVNRDIDIVRTYKDEGRSGLTLHRREGLQQLLDDVQTGRADFSTILVYDVSRWGRFQDIDESAHYEFICKRAGIRVIYCAEQFENDDSPASVIVKALKRMMAGEYSRELSQKVRASQCRIAAKGFKVGGHPLFGLRRVLIDKDGRPKSRLAPGERKALQSDRVILAPGPRREAQAVRYMFQTLVKENRSPKEIAAALNDRGIAAANGARWTHKRVRNVLRNPKYAGHNLFNVWKRELGKRGKHIKNPPDQWVYARNVFKPVVAPELFDAAQECLTRYTWRTSPDRIVSRLRQLLEEHGTLSLEILRRRGGVSPTTVRNRLGGMQEAYAAVGFTPARNPAYAKTRSRLRRLRLDLLDDVRRELGELGVPVGILSMRTGMLLVNKEMTVAAVVARRLTSLRRAERYWRIYFQTHRPCDLALVRLVDDEMQETIGDYVFAGQANTFSAYVSEKAMARHDSRRLKSLSDFYERFIAVNLPEAHPT